MSLETPRLMKEIDVPQFRSDETVKVQIFDGIDPRHLPVAGSVWDKAAIELMEPDTAWSVSWPSLLPTYIAEQREAARAFSVVGNGILQGIATGYATQIPEIYEGKFFYIDRLASAPWNRRHAYDKQEWDDLDDSTKKFPKLVGIGLLLAKICLSFSEKAGYNQRLAGCVLPEAIGFYRKLGFEAVGHPRMDGAQWMRRPLTQ